MAPGPDSQTLPAPFSSLYLKLSVRACLLSSVAQAARALARLFCCASMAFALQTLPRSLPAAVQLVNETADLAQPSFYLEPHVLLQRLLTKNWVA